MGKQSVEMLLVGENAAPLASLNHQSSEGPSVRRTLEQLMETSAALIGGRELGEVLDTILRGVQAIGFDRVRLYTLSADRATIVAQAQVGMAESCVGHVLPVAADDHLQELMAHPRPQIFRRADGRPLHEQLLGPEELDEWACVPLILRGEVVGKLSMDNQATRRPIGADELDLAALFASQAAAAIDKARLIEEIAQERDSSQRMASQLMALYKITRQMQSELDLSSLLNLISRLAARLLDADAAGILLLDEGRQHLTFKGAYRLSKRIVDGTRDEVGTSIAGRVVRTGKPIIANDIPNDLRFENPAADREGLLAVISTPLRVNGAIIGTLDAHSKTRRFAFDQHDLQILSLMASQAAIAIENARLFQQTSRRTQALEALHRTSLDITSHRQVPELVQLILDRAVGLLQAKGGALYLLDETGQQLRVVAVANLQEQLKGMTLDVGDSLVGRAIKTKASIAVSNYRTWPDRLRLYDVYGFTAVAGTPIASRDTIRGVLAVHDDDAERVFDQEALDLLSHFGNWAAVALENAELAARASDKLNRLEQLTQANNAIMCDLGTMPLHERLGLIAKHAAEILGAEACGICLVCRPGVLSLEASYGHREERFERGREFLIQSGPQSGLTGHIAYEGKLFNVHGPDLIDHFAVKRRESHHAPSEACYSLLAIPLTKRTGAEQQLIGLLRVDNKKDRHGQPGPSMGFSEEDERILQLFADAVVVAIEGAGLVTQLSEQKDRLERLIASSPNGVIAIDLHGKVTGFNARAAEILRYQPQEVLNTSVDRLYDDPQEPRRIGERLRATPDGKLAHYETFVRSSAGERIPISLAATWLYNAYGNPIGSVGYFEDLRSIRETERRLDLLLKASNVVAQAENLTDGLHSLAEMMVTLLDTTFCRILLLDESQQFLLTEAAYPPPQPASSLDWQPGLGEQIAVAEWPGLAELLPAGTAQVFSMTDGQSQTFLTGQSGRLGLKQPIQSLLVLPLRTRNRAVGALALGELRVAETTSFSEEQQELAAAIADQAAVLLERVQRHEITRRRQQRLAALDEALLHIHADKEPFKLIQEILHAAVLLVGATAGGLYVNWPHLQELELHGVAELPIELIGSRQSHAIGLAGQVARAGQIKLIRDYTTWPEREALLDPSKFATAVGVPIKQAGEVQAVLLIAYANHAHLTEIDLEILERFALRAYLALQTARLMSHEQRMLRPLTMLHRMSQYIQTIDDIDKIMHVVLTCVTAGYCLGFNRAALFLFDESREVLEGRMGIGNLTEADAQEAWERHRQQGLEDFGHYLEMLNRDTLPPTPIGRLILGLRFAARSVYTDVFWHTVYEQQYIFAMPDILHRLPSSFIAAFEPALPFVVVPLIAGEAVIGFLVADNKFTRSPITSEDVELLLTFASTAALVLDNARLLQEMRAEQEKLRSLYRTSDALIGSRQPRRVLQDIVEQTRAAAKAASVSLLLIDELGRVRDLVTAGLEGKIDHRSMIRPNGISVQVLDTGRHVTIEDTTRQRERINPSMIANEIAAALCLPLSLPLQGRRVGVVWIHYRKARRFSKVEVEALQLYVNQAAIAYDNARRVKELEYMRQAIEALSGAAGLPNVREQIVRTAQVVLRADSVVIWSYNAVLDRFVLEDSVAVGIPAEMWEQFRKQSPLKGGTAYTVMERGWVGVEDIDDAERYAFIGESTHELLWLIGARSFQGMALNVGDECLGVLYANYNRPRPFSEDDQRDLKSLAAQAAVATQNARRFEDLKHIKGYIGSQTAVDWIRMVSTAWGHGIRREVGNALGRVALLRGLFERQALPREIQSELDQLDSVIRGIKEIPIIAPLSYEDAVDSVKINDLVKTYLDRQWKLARYSPVQLRYDLEPGLDGAATIRASREWLRQALEIPIDNAVQAMLDADSPHKQLTVTTRRQSAQVEIAIQDTGPGIPDHVVEKLFKEPIEKPVGSRGAGIGLMLAHTIICAYAGNMYFTAWGERGTQVVIVLPIEHQLT